MKIAIKVIGTDYGLGVLRVGVTVSDNVDACDYEFFMPLPKDTKPTPEDLEKFIDQCKIISWERFGKEFKKEGAETPTPAVPAVSKPAKPKSGPVPAPAPAPGPAPAPAAKLPPPVPAAKLPPVPPPAPAPAPVPPPAPAPAAAPVPPPAPAPAAAPVPPPAAAPAPGIKYDRANAEHTLQVKNILTKCAGAEWSKNPETRAAAKSLIGLLDGKVTIFTKPGELHPTFEKKIKAYMVDGQNLFDLE